MKTVFLILAIVFSALTAQAQQQTALSFRGIPLGASPEKSYRLGPNFGLRGIAGFRSNANSAPLPEATSIGILADIYFGDSGRVTAGVISRAADNSSAQAPQADHGQINILPFVKLSVSFAF